MLRKIVHIVFALLLVVATTGFTISKHYCGNQLLSVSIFKVDHCKCGGPCKNCHTNIKVVKVTDNFSASEKIFHRAPISSFALLVYNNEILTLSQQVNISDFFVSKDPPPYIPDHFILHQSFRC